LLVDGFYEFVWYAHYALAAFALYAFADACFRRSAAYPAADKRTKPFWLLVLALCTLITFFLPLVSLLPMAAAVAVIVYVVDVRPAVRGLTPHRGGGGSSDGPYGPYNGMR
jgi:hypothetical protein